MNKLVVLLTSVIGVSGVVHYALLLVEKYGPEFLVREEDQLLNLARPEDCALVAAVLRWVKVKWPDAGTNVKAKILEWVPEPQRVDVGNLIDALEKAEADEAAKLDKPAPPPTNPTA